MRADATLPGARALARLADFCAALRYEDLPEAVAAKARLHLLDTLGAGMAGTCSREFAQVLATIETRTDGAAAIWGSGRRASMRDAALVNGVAAHAFELDDTGGSDHSGAVVIPAILAAAEGRRVSGRDLIVAIVVGYEVGRRVLDAAGGFDRHNGAGWYSTGTCGAIAAAAGVGRLWGLTATEMRNALTIATGFGSGLWAFIHDGAQTKRIHAGRAAESGVLAAQLAIQEFKGPSRVFDPVWGGFFQAHDQAPGDPTRFTDRLGEVYQLLRVSLRPYASCRSAHSAIDALAAILADARRGVAEVGAIEVRASRFVVEICGRSDIEPLTAAQMSLPLALALLTVHGRAGLSAYSSECRHDPRVVDLLRRVTIVTDPTQAAMDEPVVSVRFFDGAAVEKRVTHPTGSPERPMAMPAVAAKFAELAGMRYAPNAVSRLAAHVIGLADIEDVTPLLNFLGAGLPTATPFR